MSYISFQPDPAVHTYRYRAAHIDAPRMPQLVGRFPQIHIITYISKKLWRTNHRYHAIQVIQGGEDPYGALRCRSFIAKEPQIIGLFCGKRSVKIRHPMGLRHPVRSITHVSWVGRKDRRMRRLNSYVMFRKHMSLRTYPLNPSYWSSQSLYTACCIWSVISSSSNLNRWSSSRGLFYHVPLKRDQGDSNWRLRFNDIPNAIGCTYHPYGVATIRRLLIIIGLFCRI